MFYCYAWRPIKTWKHWQGKTVFFAPVKTNYIVRSGFQSVGRFPNTHNSSLWRIALKCTVVSLIGDSKLLLSEAPINLCYVSNVLASRNSWLFLFKRLAIFLLPLLLLNFKKECTERSHATCTVCVQLNMLSEHVCMEPLLLQRTMIVQLGALQKQNESYAHTIYKIFLKMFIWPSTGKSMH